MINRAKGTQDFLDLTLWNFMVDQIRKHLAIYNYSEIMTPIIEPLELFKRSLGATTDVVSKEMFTLTSNKQIDEDDDTLCLRPEITASIVRAFTENHVQQTPWKVFVIGPTFRRERPQKGRYRQFHQLSVEAIGSASMSQDALFIKMLDQLFCQRLKLDSYALHLNFLGTPHDRARHKQELFAFLEKNISSICPMCQTRRITNTMRVFDCKNPDCQQLYVQAPKITQYLSDESQREWITLKNELELLSVSFVEVPTLVRGLDYYNKTVFEFVSPNLGAQSSFCGGGRYEYLVKEVGGEQDQPSIGAAPGLERILMLLEPIKDQLPLAQPAQLTVVVPLETAQNPLALLLTETIARNGITCDVLLDEQSLKGKMRKVNSMGARWAVIVGSDEQQNRTVVLRDMTSAQQETIAQTELINRIKR